MAQPMAVGAAGVATVHNLSDQNLTQVSIMLSCSVHPAAGNSTAERNFRRMSDEASQSPQALDEAPNVLN